MKSCIFCHITQFMFVVRKELLYETGLSGFYSRYK